MSRAEVAERLTALGNALASGSEVELSACGDTLKLGVASQVDWELEIEIDGDETELEIEIKWRDDPSGVAAPVESADAAADEDAAPAKPTPARRGRPRKAAAG